MHLLLSGSAAWEPTVASLSDALVMAIIVHIVGLFIQRRLSGRRRGSQDHVPVSGQPQGLRVATHLTSHAADMTPDQEADLIERGLPEILVRSGALDYASLTSGCMADRIKNGYA